MAALFCHPLTPLGRYVRYGLIGLTLAPIAAIFAIQQGFDLPIHCLFQATFGMPGPGCGLTRSWLALARGDWAQSFQYHLFGPMLFGLCWVMLLQSAVELGWGRSLKGPTGRPLARLYTQVLLHPGFFPTTLLLLLAYYGLRLYARYDGGVPDFWVYLPLWQGLVTGAKAL